MVQVQDPETMLVGEAPEGDEQPVTDEELLVEDVSIDGMCGVY
jgi:mycofactocin precursor